MKMVRCKKEVPYTQDMPSSILYHLNLTKRGYRALVYRCEHRKVQSIPNIIKSRGNPEISGPSNSHYRDQDEPLSPLTYRSRPGLDDTREVFMRVPLRTRALEHVVVTTLA